MNDEWTQAQTRICEKYEVSPFPTPRDLKVGISQNVRQGLQPVNGMRCRPEGDTSGWYIWAGEELSKAPDFFAPLHIEHLDRWCPVVVPFLLLPPGWRFLIAPDHEDVWFDDELLDG